MRGVIVMSRFCSRPSALLAAEEQAEHRQVAEDRELVLLVDLAVLEEAADEGGLAARAGACA